MRDNDHDPTPEPTELPGVEEGVLLDLEIESLLQPEVTAVRFQHLNEADHVLAHETIIEAGRRAQGDLARQQSFIEGAAFIFEAVSRQLKTIKRRKEAPADPPAIA